MPGFFIVLEGPDGGGTTLHVRLLCEKLRESGHEVVQTKEPTDGPCGKKIREAISGDSLTLPPEEFHKLFSDDRAEHIAEVIQPALDAGKIVVTDRYIPSSLIYGSASGVDQSLIESWNADFPQPNMTIFTLPSFAVCQERLGRRDDRDALEQEDYAKRVYDGYVQYAKDHPEVITVDTSGGKQEVADEIWKELRVESTV